MNKYIDFSNLPKRKSKINWEKSVGYNVYFEYDDISGYIEILNVNIKTRKIKLQYANNIDEITIPNFHSYKIGKLLKRKTKEFKFELGFTINNMIVTDREYRVHKGIENRKWYKYKCNNCGWTEGWILECNLSKGVGCSCCYGRTTVQGINDIPTTDPWMVKYFQGGYDEAKMYTKSSNKYIQPKCPDCNVIRKNPIKISGINTNDSIGCMCSDKTSYPEKFIYTLLKQLDIKFTPQLNRSTFDWCDKYKYDFYLTDYNTIVETHGKQHYEWTGGYMPPVEEEINNDAIKKELAINNSISNYIVIDCRISDFDFIKTNIINSKLSKIINLEDIDWDAIRSECAKNLVKTICEYYELNKDIETQKYMANKFKIHEATLGRYLTIGASLNWCVPKGSKKKIRYIEENEVFESMSECVRQLYKKYNIKVNTSNISRVCNGMKKNTKGLHFEFV